MAQAIVHQPRNARDRTRSLASKCGVSGGRIVSEVFLQEFRFSPVGIIPKMPQRIYLLPMLCEL